ncbi:MAG: histidine phosphatase family protein [Streptococcus sp.]|nr:histidine phosphatase family protein [Streptococcus sp.]
MSKTKIYLVRHGKTMFNTIGRAQGWSDTPLTVVGEEGIRELGLGFKHENIIFNEAFSSDSGRTLQTMEIILKECQQTTIPYTKDKRIREWCFGNFDGGYDVDLFTHLLPRVFNCDVRELTYPELVEGIKELDTTGWAESWEQLSTRILSGFRAIGEKIESEGGGNAVVVSHGLTIATFLWMIDANIPRSVLLENGSVSVLEFEKGHFSIKSVGDMSYREIGRKVLGSL